MAQQVCLMLYVFGCFLVFFFPAVYLLWLLVWIYELYAQAWERKKGWKTIENQSDWYCSINQESWQTEVCYCSTGRKGAEKSRPFSTEICVMISSSEHPPARGGPELSSILPLAEVTPVFAPRSRSCQILQFLDGSKAVPFAQAVGQELLSRGGPWLQPWLGMLSWWGCAGTSLPAPVFSSHSLI